MTAAIALFLGLALGFLLAHWLRRSAGTEEAVLRERLAQREAALAALEAEAKEKPLLLAQLAEARTLLDQEKQRHAEKIVALEQANKEGQTALLNAFKTLSGEALEANNRRFLDLAKENLAAFQESAKGDLEKRQISIAELMKPVKESLDRFEGKIGEIEKSRVGAYEGLRQHLELMGQTQERLRAEAANLVKALRAPATRGRWGEIQLRRVVEMAGMVEYCDFTEQESTMADSGRLRPDLVVRLPSKKSIVVDAKAPLASYLEAAEAQDEETRLLKLRDHARQIRDHIAALSRKSYWEQFSPSPEFVVLFLPGENFFGAALEHDPGLIEAGVEKRVILATPTTLIALLQAVAYGWRQESLAANAQEISALGAELHKRLATMTDHWNDMGKHLGQSVDAYNKATSSLTSRVLVTAKKFKELDAAHASSAELPEAKPVEKVVDMGKLREELDLG